MTSLSDLFFGKKKKEILKKEKDSYGLEDFFIVKIRDGGEFFYCLFEPDGNMIAFVGVTLPQKPCNLSAQVKHIAVIPKYRGKGVGSYLYKLAAYVAENDMGKSAITSDHTESTTLPAKSVWDNMIPKKFDQVQLKGGNAKFDYTGEDTPDFEDDDCTRPTGGNPATDYAWKIKPGEMSAIVSLVNRQLKNAEESQIKPSEEEMYKKIEELWNNTYSSSAGIAESTYQRWGKLANILAD